MRDFNSLTPSRQGFTLLELMIAIAVVAIVAAVALPSYLSYATKAKISEGLIIMDGIKLQVQEIVNTEGQLDPNLVSIQETGLGRYVEKAGIVYAPGPDIATPSGGTTFGSGSAIWVRYGANIAPVKGKCLNLVPQLWNDDKGAMDDIIFVQGDGVTVTNLAPALNGGVASIQWSCRTYLLDPIRPSFLPSNCRDPVYDHTVCPTS